MRLLVLIGWIAIAVMGIPMTARCSDINGKFLTEDARLRQKVTIVANRVLVGDLIADLKKQTGIPIDIDPNDYAPGVEVFASCKGLRLCDVLDAITALLSDGNGEYRWYREGRAPTYLYRLSEPAAAKNRIEALHREAQGIYVDYMNALCDLVELTPDEHPRQPKTLNKLLIEVGDQRLDQWLNGDANRLGIALFAEVVPSEKREAVLRGDRIVNVPLASVSGKARELFQTVLNRIDAKVRQPDGTYVSPPKPSVIHIYARRIDLVPELMIETGPNLRAGLVSPLPVQSSLRSLVMTKWYLPLDLHDDRRQNEHVHDPDAAARDEDEVRLKAAFDNFRKTRDANAIRGVSDLMSRTNASRTYDAQLGRIADGSGVPVLAVLPNTVVRVNFVTHPRVASADQSTAKSTATQDQTVAEALAPLEQSGNPLMHKWRNGILLVSYPDWFNDNDRGKPYGLLKEAVPGGPDKLSLEALAKLMVEVSDREFADIAERYPSLRGAEAMRSLFLLAKPHPEILRAEGIAVDEDTLRYLSTSRYGRQPAISEGRLERIRLLEVERSFKQDTRTFVEFQGFVDGRWRLISGYAKPNSRDRAQRTK